MAVGGGRGFGVGLGTGHFAVLGSQLLVTLGSVVLLGGIASLQKRSDNLSNTITDTPGIIDSIFAAAQHIPPYPLKGHYQWGLVWWVLAGNAALSLGASALALAGGLLGQWKAALTALFAYFALLLTLLIDFFLFMNRTPGTNIIFSDKRIRATLAGVFILAIADLATIVSLGLVPSGGAVAATTAAAVPATSKGATATTTTTETPAQQAGGVGVV